WIRVRSSAPLYFPLFAAFPASRRGRNTIRLKCPAHSLTMASMASEEGKVGGEVDSIGIAEIRNALAWWLEAGVDVAVQEEPRDWLKPAAPQPRSQPAQQTEPANIARPTHDTLAELQDWLASSAQLPLASTTARRIMPHGPEQAAIMLLSDAPTLEDFAA